MGSGQKIKFFFITKAAKLLINSIIFTCRKITIGKEKISDLKNSGKPIIYIFWHRHIFFNIFRFRRTNAQPLISHSTDGEIVARIAKEFGMNPIRGSSSKGGAKAFLNMVNSIKNRNSEIMITADGPKGPSREIKDGTVLIAKKTGAAIIPVSWYASRVKIFENSWDKFILPKPFGKIIFKYGDPISIPHDIEKNEYPDYKKKLKKRLDTLEEEIIAEFDI